MTALVIVAAVVTLCVFGPHAYAYATYQAPRRVRAAYRRRIRRGRK